MSKAPIILRGPRLEDHSEVVSSVRAAGGVILIPTESFYGLGVDPMNAAAVERVFALKDRAADQPLLVLVADLEQAATLVELGEWRGRLDALWPAPLTAILPCLRPCPAAGPGGLAIRVPAHPELRALLGRVGPLTGTSANRHQAPPADRVEAALAGLEGTPDLVLDGGPTAGGFPSTLVDLTSLQAVVLRAGREAEKFSTALVENPVDNLVEKSPRCCSARTSPQLRKNRP